MSLKQPIYYEYSLDNKYSKSILAVTHIDDTNVDVIELAVKQKGEPVDLSGAQVIARFVAADGNVLLADNVVCEVNESGNIEIPFDNAVISSRAGYLDIEVNITKQNDVLTLQFPLTVCVNPSVLEHAHIGKVSQGTIPALLEQVNEELARVGIYADEDTVYEILDNTLSGEASNIPALLCDSDNQSGDCILYYVDSEEVRHELFNFSQYFAEKASVYNKTQTDAKLGNKVDNSAFAQYRSTVYTKSEIDSMGYLTAHQDISGKENTSNRLAELRENETDEYGIFVPIDLIYGDDSKYPSIQYLKRAFQGFDIQKADRADVPMKTSDLRNDSGFLTSHQDISGKLDKLETSSGSGWFVRAEADGTITRANVMLGDNKSFIESGNRQRLPTANAVKQYVEAYVAQAISNAGSGS